MVRMSTPMPPSQWMKDRQKEDAWAGPPTAGRMDAPVVVKPLAASEEAVHIGGRAGEEEGGAPRRRPAPR